MIDIGHATRAGFAGACGRVFLYTFNILGHGYEQHPRFR